MFEILGWAGAFLFAFCGIPQAVKTYKTKRADDLSWLFVFMWLGGEICAFIYILHDNLVNNRWQMPLLFNYLLNTIVVVYILYCKFVYGNNDNEKIL